MKRIVVVGAAGYVGRHLLDVFSGRGRAVTALCRPTGAMLLKGATSASIVTDGKMVDRDPDVLINLAYPTDGQAFERSDRVKRIYGMIAAIAGPSTHVIHVSTMAVFGYELDYPIRHGPVSWHPDFEYIQSKIAMEQLVLGLHRRRKIRQLSIVRAGNVWGPGSPAWTAKIADRIIFGDPIRSAAGNGFSNVTDVHNLAALIGHLTDAECGTAGELQFIHAAELAHVPWDYWIEKMEEWLGFQGVTVELPVEPRNSFAEIWQHLPRLHYRQAAAGLWRARRSGAMFRAVMAYVPKPIAHKLTVQNVGVAIAGKAMASESDVRFLSILACRTKFEPTTLDGWSPPLSRDDAWNGVAQWMKVAGYTEKGGGYGSK